MGHGDWEKKSSSSYNSWGCCPALELCGRLSFRFRRTFAEVITLGEASAH